jgi:hypothetical protein
MGKRSSLFCGNIKKEEFLKTKVFNIDIQWQKKFLKNSSLVMLPQNKLERLPMSDQFSLVQFLRPSMSMPDCSYLRCYTLSVLTRPYYQILGQSENCLAYFAWLSLTKTKGFITFTTTQNVHQTLNAQYKSYKTLLQFFQAIQIF